MSMVPIYALGGLALITAITMSAAGCQTQLLHAGSAEYRLKVRDAIAADDKKVIQNREEIIAKLVVNIKNTENELLNNKKVHNEEREVLNNKIQIALTKKTDWQCPGEEEWLRIASCPAPF